ncbi:MAG: hypothetical protein ABIQ09_04835 [Jatrophihabitantaceae bacterium]
MTSVPAAARGPRRITDRYLDGTTLRLRRVEDAGAVTYKLGQKIRADVDDPFVVRVTNLYLTAQEYQRLAALPAAVLVKTRWLVFHGAAGFAVDEFDGPLRGLLLAETELPETEPAETELAETELPETELAETELPETELPETEPAETEPAETEPAETEPAGGVDLPLALPRWLGREVTHDDRYSGAALARQGRPSQLG